MQNDPVISTPPKNIWISLRKKHVFLVELYFSKTFENTFIFENLRADFKKS